MKKAVFFHTTLNTPLYMKNLFKERYPDVELYNYVDDSILQEVTSNDFTFTPNIVRKLVEYGHNAEMLGASVIMNMCTTLAPAVKIAQQSLNIPFVCVDGPMLKEAVHAGKKIAMIITAATTVKPSTLAIHAVAEEEGIKDIEIDVIYVDGAFEALTQHQDKEKHDRLVLDAIRNAEKNHDAIVLAQVTMAGLVDQLEDIREKILISPYSGLEQLSEFL